MRLFLILSDLTIVSKKKKKCIEERMIHVAISLFSILFSHFQKTARVALTQAIFTLYRTGFEPAPKP